MIKFKSKFPHSTKGIVFIIDVIYHTLYGGIILYTLAGNLKYLYIYIYIKLISEPGC